MAQVAALQPRAGRGTAGLNPTGLLFLLCFVLAQADKQVVGLLAVPLQEAFALSNTQLGFLQGGAWAVAYAIGGLPVARLLDSGNRVRIAAMCVAAWSVATIACGLAGSFLLLILFRATTAVAEAGLPPAAFSVFSASGDRRHAARMTSTFMLAPFIGGGLVLLLGGLLIKALSNSASPMLAGIDPWRAVFVAVGVPGLLLAPMLARFGREPARTASANKAEDRLPPMSAVFGLIFKGGFLRAYYLGLTAFYVVAAALIAWYPTLLVREFGLSTAAAGGFAGGTYLVAGIAGTLTANMLARLRASVTIRVMTRDYVVIASVLAPAAVLLPLVGNLYVSLALYALYAFLSAIVMASMAVPMQLALPPAMLARGIAVSSLMMSALAGSAGPLLVGALSDRSGITLGLALAITGGAAAALASVLLFAALGHAAEPDPMQEKA